MHHRQIRAHRFVFLVPTIPFILQGTIHFLQSRLVSTHGLQKRLLQVIRTMRFHDFLINVLRRMQIILLTPNISMRVHENQSHGPCHLRVLRKTRHRPLTRNRIEIQGIRQLHGESAITCRLLQAFRTKMLTTPRLLRHLPCKFRKLLLPNGSGRTIPRVRLLNRLTQLRGTPLRHFPTTPSKSSRLLLQPRRLTTRTTTCIVSLIGCCLLSGHANAPLLLQLVPTIKIYRTGVNAPARYRLMKPWMDYASTNSTFM